MSDKAQTLDQPLSGPDLTSTRVAPEPIVSGKQRSRWPGWIWSVPIAALVIVGYLAFKQITTTGPEITVIFQGGGISTGTSVQYQNMNVGQVIQAAFEPDLQHVRARIRMDAAMKGHLGSGTQFWIVGPTLSDLASIKSIISGPSIGFLPQPGAAQNEYVALNEPPLLEGIVPGRSFVLHAKDLGNISRGSSVFFRELKVGAVQSSKLLPDGTFSAILFIEAPYDKLVHDDTQFWNGGGVQFSLQGSGPHLQVPPISALIGGAIAFDSPASATGKVEAASGRTFTLYANRNDAMFAPAADAVLYRVVFGADAGGISDGAPVMLAGKQVGTVQQSELRYNSQAGDLMQPVTLLIDPSRLGLPASTPAKGRAELDAVMQHLIGQGLRAQPGSVIPLVGPADVELSFVHDAPSAELTGDPPELPVAPGGGGIQGIMIALNTIANKVDGLPLDQIAGDIHVATARLAELSKSPALSNSLEALDRTVENLERTTSSVRVELPSLLSDLRGTAREAESTVSETRQMIATINGQGPVGLNSSSLSQTLYELTRAAQAMRELADYLDRNPTAVFRGRQ